MKLSDLDKIMESIVYGAFRKTNEGYDSIVRRYIDWYTKGRHETEVCYPGYNDARLYRIDDSVNVPSLSKGLLFEQQKRLQDIAKELDTAIKTFERYKDALGKHAEDLKKILEEK